MPEIHTVGTLYSPEGEPLAGWHVNATGEIPALAVHRVDPATPRCVFAGVPTYFYRFEDQQQAEQLVASATTMVEDI